MTDPSRGGESRAPKNARTPKIPQIPEDAKSVTSANAGHTPNGSEPNGKRLRLVASGGLVASGVSAAAQYFNLVPQGFHTGLNGASALVAATAFAYIVVPQLIPRKIWVEITWDRDK